MKKIKEYLILYLLSGVFIFFGKVFVYMLGDQHAFGDSLLYYLSSIFYLVVVLFIIYFGVKRLRIINTNKANKFFDASIFIAYNSLVYLIANAFISKYVVYLV